MLYINYMEGKERSSWGMFACDCKRKRACKELLLAVL